MDLAQTLEAGDFLLETVDAPVLRLELILQEAEFVELVEVLELLDLELHQLAVTCPVERIDRELDEVLNLLHEAMGLAGAPSDSVLNVKCALRLRFQQALLKPLFFFLVIAQLLAQNLAFLEVFLNLGP